MIQIPFTRSTIRNIAPEYLKKALAGERFELIELLEAKVGESINAPYVIAVSNPTLAIHLALSALDMKRGDRMIASVNAHPAAGLMIRQFDAEPIFVDIDPDVFNMSLDDLADKLATNRHKKTRGIFCTLIAGQAAYTDKIFALAKEHKVLCLIECCGSLGAIKIKDGAPDMLVTSVYPIDGYFGANVGFIATTNKEFSDRARLIRNHGFSTEYSGDKIYDYDVVELGYDFRPSAVDAAYMLSVSPIYTTAKHRRFDIAKKYDKAFADLSHLKTPVVQGDHMYTAYIVKIDKNRDSFARSLAERGIETKLNFVPLHMMSYYRAKYSLKLNKFPCALSNYQHILSLPIYADLKESEVKHIIDSVREIDQSRTW
ncbi:MAG: DegT/DnrJ/EryC1/StrS aminotransferase family protein [Helicobacteraceae bacterium]|jgi:dTDP-4-amino-4,6-dideoxygalactose transaminase|nr:DegT/DnrJ/EryC1/StrS aminotransferase family protein [Helicobacteraceae bacterium]